MSNTLDKAIKMCDSWTGVIKGHDVEVKSLSNNLYTIKIDGKVIESNSHFSSLEHAVRYAGRKV